LNVNVTVATRLNVLLVEDHETVRAGLRLIIDGQTDMAVVGEAAEGSAALGKAQVLAPDIVVMDISMPGLNGVEATRALRQAQPGTRIVTLTRHREPGYLDLLLRAGASAYVLKQSRPAELLAAIRAVARGGTYVDPSIAGQITREPIRKAVTRTSVESPLSPRETQVLRLIAWGHSNKDIAGQLEVSVKTVETHKANAMHKLGLQSRIDIVRYALLHGWLRDS
jgi:DNA-binding NarL/FixJ family response regulator